MSILDNMRRRNDPQPRDLDEHKPFDVNTIEDDLAEVLRDQQFVSAYAGPRHAALVTPPTITPLPEYVQHAEGVDEIGKITAQAVVSQHEAAAKAVEAMGDSLKRWTAAHEQALADLAAASKYVEETVQRLREVGASAFERLQKSSIAIAEVRKTCDDMRGKIDLPF